MENYQTATVIVGIISTILWGIVGMAYSWIFLIPALLSFVFMFTCFADTKHCHTIGGVYIVVAIFANILYLIPAIMALRWKPSLKDPIIINNNVYDQRDAKIADLEKQLKELKKE